MNNKQNKIELSNNRTDYATSIAKSLAGVVPFAGSAIAEIVGAIIPNQRVDRIIEFIKILDEKLYGLGEDVGEIKERMMKEDFIDLFEDGIFQASRAISRERKEYISSLLKNSISKSQLDYTEKKKLLSMLAELSDIEIIILISHSFHDNSKSYEFYKLHEDVLHRPAPTMAASEEEIKEAAINNGLYDTYENHLIQLSLLQTDYREPRRDELPEFDYKTGRLKSGSMRITSLGRLLLEWLDIGKQKQ